LPESKAKILVRNTKWIYISKLFSQLFGLLATVLVIRQVAVDVFGTFNLLLSSFVVFQIFALSAVQNVFNRYIPELISNHEYHKLNRLLGGGFFFSLVLFTLLVGALYFYRDPFATFFNVENFHKYLLAFLVFNYAHFFHILSGVILRALLLHKQAALITIFTSALKLGLYIYFFNELDVNLLLYIESTIGIIFLLAGSYFYLKHLRSFDYSKTRTGITPVTYKRVRRYGLLSMANELGVGLVGKTSDYFIVAALSNPYQVGLFAFAHRIYGMVFKVLPFKDIQSVVRPLFFQKYSQQYDIEEFQKIFAFMIKLLLPVYVFPALYFFFFGKSIISVVFDPRYLDAYWITVIVLSSNFFLAFFFPLSLTAQLKERMDILLYSKIVAVFSIFAGILGMKYLGVIGVAIASVLGSFLKNAFIYYFMSKYKEVQYKFADYKRFLVIGLLLIPFLALHQIMLNAFLLIMLSILFFAYALIIFFLFHPYTNFELALLKKISSKSTALHKTQQVVVLIYDKLSKFKFVS